MTPRYLSPYGIEDDARRLWDAHPHLALAHGDFGCFLEAHRVRYRDALAYSDASCDEWAGEFRVHRDQAVQRMASMGHPSVTPNTPLVERIGSRLVVWIYGPLGPIGIAGAEVCEQLHANADAAGIIVRIASAGGSANCGQVIATGLLNMRGRVVTVIDRFAYSAASLIAAAGHRCVIRKSATWMCHQAHKTASGNADQLMEHVRSLRYSDMAAEHIYRKRRRVGASEIHRLHNSERYLSAEEAVALGVCDAVIPDLPEWSDPRESECEHETV